VPSRPRTNPTTPKTKKTQEDAVQAHIDSNKVAIFSKTYCPYCTRAKSLFADTLKVPAGVVELDAIGAEGAAMQQALQARTGMRTVPQVFVSGKLIGGCDGEFLGGFVIERHCRRRCARPHALLPPPRTKQKQNRHRRRAPVGRVEKAARGRGHLDLI
jgi:glutaredoxin 3